MKSKETKENIGVLSEMASLKSKLDSLNEFDRLKKKPLNNKIADSYGYDTIGDESQLVRSNQTRPPSPENDPDFQRNLEIMRKNLSSIHLLDNQKEGSPESRNTEIIY